MSTIFYVAGTSDTGFQQQSNELDPALLEEALNLLLVNKTVMSCMLILQSRESHDNKDHPQTENDQYQVTHFKPKVCFVQHCVISDCYIITLYYFLGNDE